jgi:hypothetical protein
MLRIVIMIEDKNILNCKIEIIILNFEKKPEKGGIPANDNNVKNIIIF